MTSTTDTDPWTDLFSAPEVQDPVRAEDSFHDARPGDRGELLVAVADKRPKRFEQWDGFPDWMEDSHDLRRGIQMGDNDGHVVFGPNGVWELRRGTPVRVQIEMGVSRREAAALLRKIADSVEQRGIAR